MDPVGMDNIDLFDGNMVLQPLPGPKSTIKPRRGQANKRERVRTENVNAGFETLRKLIPTDPKDRKLSKIEVLRLATSYIKHLHNLTRANSCQEIDEMKRLARLQNNEKTIPMNSNKNDQDLTKGDMVEVIQPQNEDIKSGKSLDRDSNKKKPPQICTFCLMIGKMIVTK